MRQSRSTTPPNLHDDALELGDDLVQMLTVAKLALEVGDTVQAAGALDAALSIARHTMTELSEALLTVEGSETMLGVALRSRPAPGATPNSRRPA